ncbi:hypothetical protein PI124_g20890 [Phytophthora idaei]|nr:hypothetical protein PI126_g20572 [Phytophthora idaei]KAG3234054.1 hypothetical protein PI124_g20890 [Phytophthora idaei]
MVHSEDEETKTDDAAVMVRRNEVDEVPAERIECQLSATAGEIWPLCDHPCPVRDICVL